MDNKMPQWVRMKDVDGLIVRIRIDAIDYYCPLATTDGSIKTMIVIGQTRFSVVHPTDVIEECLRTGKDLV